MDIMLISQVIRLQGYEVIRNLQTNEYVVFDPICYTIIPIHTYIDNLHKNYVLCYNHYINQQIINQQIINQLNSQNKPLSPPISPTSPPTPKPHWNCF